jgi:exopolysaccharide biosynthesis polyprenyl glycosylphosphotransferase
MSVSNILGRRQEVNLQLTELIDSAILAASLWTAYVLRAVLFQSFYPQAEIIPPIQEFFWVGAVVVLFTPILLEAHGFYHNILNKGVGRSLSQMAGALVWMGMCIGGFVIFFKWSIPSRSVMILAILVAATLLLLREAYQRDLVRRKISTGRIQERVLIAGVSSDAENLLRGFSAEQRAELEVCGVIDITTSPVADLVEAMHEHSISRVLFAVQHVHFGKLEEAVLACETEGVEAWIAAFDMLNGKLMLVFHSAPQASWSLICKNMIDRAGALSILLASLPLWLVAYIGIRLTSPGPVFFRQQRSGRYGKPFMMWKFRSMHTNAEAMRETLQAKNEMDGPVFKIKADPRIFGFGQFLRKFSIDELPQIINVIRGEMSLVGPRPLPTYEINKIEKHAQRRRLSVKPGLTCLWQVSGRNRITSFDEWVQLDLKYIDNWSLLLDFEILAKTLPAVFRGSGAS